MSRHSYVLNSDHTTSRMNDLVEWERRKTVDNWVVATDRVGTWTVHTAFLGIDQRLMWNDSRPIDPRQTKPLLFETFLFDEKGNCPTFVRAPTWREACSNHATVLEQARDLDCQSSSSSSESSPAA